ncbi:MAG: tRNA preQ1(34) S-adenosylmethionine ribosyltransferase-isomerase QueA [Proteobacteria bacterium]|nr:tRNA preQ1(34) S-adenosylmethionine ribosyltransferase-isomerase QueA [Pseudomonadota bacterium]
MDIKDFYFDLPESYIAKRPLEKRDSSKLLVLKKNGEIEHTFFYNIINFFSPGDVLILNNTKVIKSKVEARKKTGGKVELLFFKDFAHRKIYCLAKGNLKDIDTVYVENNDIVLNRVKEGLFEASLTGIKLEDLLENFGEVPIPPYLKRKSDKEDEKTYQTIVAEKEGAVASPTAGLHFTEDLLRKIKENGVKIGYITLHVGPGTFLPVKVKNIEEHHMLPEYFEIDDTTVSLIKEAELNNKNIFYCGTTVVRAIETATDNDGILKPMVGMTSLFIYPGYKFKKVKNMITNFHLPASTPLLLVCALAGKENVLRAYEEAKKKNYRFFSYGDAMLILNTYEKQNV